MASEVQSLKSEPVIHSSEDLPGITLIDYTAKKVATMFSSSSMGDPYVGMGISLYGREVQFLTTILDIECSDRVKEIDHVVVEDSNLPNHVVITVHKPSPPEEEPNKYTVDLDTPVCVEYIEHGEYVNYPTERIVYLPKEVKLVRDFQGTHITRITPMPMAFELND